MEFSRFLVVAFARQTEGRMETAASVGWKATGLLFENCNCQLVCPGHMHFSQLCTHERCVGYWAVRFDQGTFGTVPLAGTKAVIAYDSPRHMIDGGWTEVIVIDPAASSEQREAVEAILDGRAGGPWAVLARFVGRRLPTRFLPVELADDGTEKRARIPGVLEGVVAAIRGRDRSRPVTFGNIFNQVHAATQVIATGTTRYDDGVIRVSTEKTHGLYSHFEWAVEPE
jgi:hypothetical protein